MIVSVALVVAAGIAAADIWLSVIAVRRQAVLAGVAGVAALSSIAFAAARGLRDGVSHAALGIALVLLIVGVALLGLGWALECLLDHSPDDGDS